MTITADTVDVHCTGNICNTSEPGARCCTSRTSAPRPAAHFPAGNVGVRCTTSSTSVGLPADKVQHRAWLLWVLPCSVIFENENENGAKQENNEFVNEN